MKRFRWGWPRWCQQAKAILQATSTLVEPSSEKKTLVRPGGAISTNRLASQTFTFDVAVTDINDQEVATQAKAIVHKGEFYVGLRPEQYVGQAGTDNPVEVLVGEAEERFHATVVAG